MKIRNFLILATTLFAMYSGTNIKKVNILIIGDSISIGYTPFVKKSLKTVANVVHNEGNAQSSSNGVAKIQDWIGSEKWDIIQFNFGLWDVAYRPAGSMKLDKVNGTITTPPDIYQTNLEKIVQELLKTKAKLIFVTTSYIPVDEPGRIAGDEDVYNAIALKVMRKYGITVNNITVASKKIHEKNGLGTNNVHYNEKGYKELSTVITAGLKSILGS